jgi:hypothetical protein
MTTLTKTDIAALELAIKQTLAEPDPLRVEQVKSMLQDRDRITVGEFCSYHRQCDALALKPWEYPPCWINDPDEVLGVSRYPPDPQAATLLKQMLAAGVSRYHPDPVAAIEAASKGDNRAKR